MTNIFDLIEQDRTKAITEFNATPQEKLDAEAARAKAKGEAEEARRLAWIAQHCGEDEDAYHHPWIDEDEEEDEDE
jgi:hypothetical protein